MVLQSVQKAPVKLRRQSRGSLTGCGQSRVKSILVFYGYTFLSQRLNTILLCDSWAFHKGAVSRQTYFGIINLMPIIEGESADPSGAILREHLSSDNNLPLSGQESVHKSVKISNLPFIETDQ